jgi:protein-disulfide isomerase
MADGQSVGVTGTPAFFINGRRISGAQPFENFKAIIDDELQRGS